MKLDSSRSGSMCERKKWKLFIFALGLWIDDIGGVRRAERKARDVTNRVYLHGVGAIWK
jgi:hypothetical protein